MRTFFKYILCLVVVCFTSTINAQTTTYPIQLHAVILPPYTNCLGDYVSPGNNRMRLTAIVKDMTRYGKDLKIAVSLKVKMGNTVLLETKSPRPQILNNVGVQTAVETADLFDPTNSFVRGKYAKNGWCLPEGAYEFEFQLFDYYNTKLPLSLPVSMFCYLNQAEPPVGLRPITASDDDCLPTTNPNITFTWMDGVASGLSQKKYTLSVYEVPDYTMVANMFGKQDVAGLVQVVNAQNLTTSTYTVMPTTTFPIEGKSYMWRVSITPDYVAANPDSKSNYTAYKNNGHSQWYAFSYGCKQPEPSKVDLSVKPEIVSFSAVEGDKSAGKVTWKLNDKFCGYILKYQNKEDKEEEWASIDVTNDRVDNEDGTSSYVVKNLAQGETFLAAVVGIVECGENQVVSGESDQKELALEALVVASKNEDDDCKINIDHVQNSDIKELKIGDCFYANGNWVRIETVSYTNGKFTGTGVYSFSFLKNVVGVNVKFTDVKINESRELIEGDVIAVSDKSDNMMININDWTNKSNTGKVDAPQQKDIPTVEMTEEQLDAELAKSSSEFEGKLIQVGDKVYTIEKKVGKLQKVELGTVQDQKTFCPPMVSGVDNENGYVKFSAINKWEPPFDYECNPFCNNVNIHEAYKHEDGYGVPWIAMAQGQTITIKAEFKNGLKSDDVAFYCYTANKTVKLTSTKVENGSCNVTIFAGEPGYALYIFAMKQTNKNSEGDDADCSGTKTFGRAQIFTCAKKDHKIKMVPVFENIAIETDKVQKELNSLYGPLGQTFVVDADGVFNDESIQKYNNNKAFELDETDAFKNESQAMKDLRRAYKKVKGDATNGYDAFIFVLPKRVASNQNVGGEMPRSNSIGYVFTSGSSYDDYRTLSHEIGHGLYSLEHTFSIFKDVAQGSTDNLMDYSSGQNLKYWQWTLVNDPKGYVLPFFDDADDAQAFGEKGTKIYCIVGSPLVNLQDMADKYRYFYLPDGTIIDVKKKAGLEILPCAFYGIDDVTESARGSVNALYFEGNSYQLAYNPVNNHVTSFVYQYKDRNNENIVDIFKVDELKINFNQIEQGKAPVRVFVNENSTDIYKYTKTISDQILSMKVGSNNFEYVETYPTGKSDSCKEYYTIPNFEDNSTCTVKNNYIDILKALNEYSQKKNLTDDETSDLVDLIKSSPNCLIIPLNKGKRLLTLLKHLSSNTNQSILVSKEKAILKLLHNIDSNNIKEVPAFLNGENFVILDNLLSRFNGDNYKELIQLLGVIYGADYKQLERAFMHIVSMERVWNSDELFAINLLNNISESNYKDFLCRLKDSNQEPNNVDLLDDKGDYKYLNLCIKNIDNYGFKWINNDNNYMEFFRSLLKMYCYVFEHYLKSKAEPQLANLVKNTYGDDGFGTFEMGDYDFNTNKVIVKSFELLREKWEVHYEDDDGELKTSSYEGAIFKEAKTYSPFTPMTISVLTDIDLINAALVDFNVQTNREKVILVPAVFLKYFHDTENAEFTKNASIATGAIALTIIGYNFAPAIIEFMAQSLARRAVQEATFRAIKGAVLESVSYIISDFFTKEVVECEDYEFQSTLKRPDFYLDVTSASVEAALNLDKKWKEVILHCFESMDLDKILEMYNDGVSLTIIEELGQECITAVVVDVLQNKLINENTIKAFKNCPIFRLNKLFDYVNITADAKAELFSLLYNRMGGAGNPEKIKEAVLIWDKIIKDNTNYEKYVKPFHYEYLAEGLKYINDNSYRDKLITILANHKSASHVVDEIGKKLSNKDPEKVIKKFIDSRYDHIFRKIDIDVTYKDIEISFSGQANGLDYFAVYDGSDFGVFVWDGVNFLKGTALKSFVNTNDSVIKDGFIETMQTMLDSIQGRCNE